MEIYMTPVFYLVFSYRFDYGDRIEFRTSDNDNSGLYNMWLNAMYRGRDG